MDKDPYRYSAALYDFVVGPLSFAFTRVRMQLAPPIQGMKVLDVGCGTGADLELYRQAGCHVYGVDLSPAMLKVAQKRLGEAADLRLCDAARMPFQDGFFDLILSTYTLHEMPYENRSAVIGEMIRVLSGDGRLLLADFQPGPYRFPIGWMSRAVILILEIMAGREHCTRGRDFLRRGGLLKLLEPYPLKVEDTVQVAAGNIAFVLLGAI